MMSMMNCNCSCRCRCAVVALIVSAIIGVLTAFLQVTAVITVAPVFLWVALGIAVVYLAVLLVATALNGCRDGRRCMCAGLDGILVGILGTILLSLVLLAVGIVATSVISAILVGLLLFFLALVFTGTACYIRTVADCDDQGC